MWIWLWERKHHLDLASVVQLGRQRLLAVDSDFAVLLRQQQEQQHRQCLRVLITRQKGCFNKSKPCFRLNILRLPYFAGACLILRRKNRSCHTFPFTIKGR